jgi:DNA polymerase-3 subunit alpha
MKIISSENKVCGELSKKDAEDVFNQLLAFQGYGFNKCLSPDTVVVSESRGKIQMKDLKLGEKILNENNEFVEVTDIYFNKALLYKVVLENGQEIIASLNHKFLCEDGIIRRLEEIIANDFNIVTSEFN